MKPSIAMADKLRLGPEVRELKIGQSFTNNKSGAFHAVRYDFKPASVDINKIATVDIGTSNQVTVNVPHLDGAGVPATVFKGSHRPFTKECVLIIDRVTGEITLEKLSSNIQLKKTRSETTRPPLPQDRGDRSTTSNTSTSSTAPPTNVLTSARPQTPPIGQRQSNKTRVTSGSRRPDRAITQLPNPTKHSPHRASPNYSSPAHKSPKRERPQNGEASLPMIGIDDFPEEAPHDATPNPPPSSINDSWKPPPQPAPPKQSTLVNKSNLSSQSDSENSVRDMSDSSSSSSSSDSDSDHDDNGKSTTRTNASNGHAGLSANMNLIGNGGAASGAGTTGSGVNGNGAKLPSLPTILNDDLQLSDSDYDDDD